MARRLRQALSAYVVLLALTTTLVATGSAQAASGFYIRGGGFGHGIGMSQYGTLGYALHGYSYASILSHYYTGTSLGTVSPGRTVTVLLETGSAAFSGASTASSGAPAESSSASTTGTSKPLQQSSTYSVTQSSSGSLELQSAGHKLGPFTAPLLVSGSGPLDLAGVGEYRGSLEFYPQSGGGIETVDAVDLEDYVRGVISKEMPSSWPAQALDVQAIAARTYALTVAPESSTFDVYPDTRSQMYGGVAAETAATDAAVAATQGQVVTYGGVPVVTYFFSSSGGYTESIQDAWPGSPPEPWLVGVPDPYDGTGGNPYYRWSVNLTIGQATSALSGLLKGTLIGIEPTAQDLTPRLATAVLVGSAGQTPVTGAQLQQLFGLLSTYVAFTTITATPGAASTSVAQRSARRAASSARSGAGAPTGGAGLGGSGRSGSGSSAASALTGGGASSGKLHLHGTVFPASAGARVAIQLFARGGFKTVAVASTSSTGLYQANLAGAGRYRVVYNGIDGPTITLTR